MSLYMEQLTDDIREAIKYGYDLSEWIDNRDGLEQKLNDDLWTDDSVTGNGSGSYTFNSWQAKEYVTCDGMGYVSDMCADFDISAEEIGRHFVQEDWEWMDVSIRCYLLGQAISEVLDDLEEEGAFEEPEPEEDE